MQFKHLKMTGFKSFAEPEEVAIEDGMTGVVGPNGCGKSNIVEALRWLMGESSARNMRGNELEDVIFSGTASRPSRNFAEVTLTLDNTSQDAPAHFNSSDEIQISRRLERGKGSTFRINGKVVRARDVQLIFADMATGSRSSGIVSQGKVDALINAKPRDRRNLLEEAASISGLHQRRHEAELRLNTAESNLDRLEDILIQLDEQKATLLKQARQAARYRSIADRIRKADAHLMLTRFTASMAQLDHTEQNLRAAEREVAAATTAVSAQQRKRDEASSTMPPLRQAEAVAAAEMQRLSIARSELDNEEERARQAAVEIAHRKEQISTDITRERQLLADAEKAVADLAEEASAITLENEGEAPKIEQAADQLEQARVEADSAEKALADAAARSRSAEREAESIQRRNDELQRQKETAQNSLAAIDLASLEDTVKALATHLKTAEAASTMAMTARIEAEATIETRRSALNTLTGDRTTSTENLARIRAETEALTALLSTSAESTATPVSGKVSVDEGFEDALAAVLGEGLAAPVGKNRNGYWAEITIRETTSCPDGATPLNDAVRAPSELAAALSGAGVVASAADAESMQPALKPGQMLTTKEGGLWRWDGFVLPNGSETSAAQRLKQEARLRDLSRQLGPLADAAGEAEEKLAAATAELAGLESSLQQLRADETEASTALNTALREDQRGRDALASAASRHDELNETLISIEASLTEAAEEAASLADTSSLNETVTSLSLVAEEKRQALADAMGAERSISNARAMRDRRQGEISREQTLWQQRQNGANERLNELNQRMTAASRDEENLSGVPERIAQQRIALADTLEKAEAERRAAGDRLAEAETRLQLLEAALRDADQNLAKAREEAIRQEAQRDLARQQQHDIVSRISERLNTRPEELAELAGLNPGDEIDTAEDTITTLEARYDRLIRERETIGPVNLRAEEEMLEIEERITSLEAERDDLIAAISKLRTAINQLNREGRERLLKSFTEVNRYFGTIFNTLFSGGTAELSLTEAEDPLEAGLEILASPPGKRLQSLNLLSGGEKALTAIALIFAVFLTNPSPICILDEVDAPLDDSNVARFCDILGQIAEKTGTRFIIVTHHRLTMARMDRLYGVTMEQKGVSRVVSVDLQAAERFDKTA